MAPTTNNKPCAQHTETSSGRSGHTSTTVTHALTAVILFRPISTSRFFSFIACVFCHFNFMLFSVVPVYPEIAKGEKP